MDDNTLVEKYMNDVEDDKGAIKFIKSSSCTIEMVNNNDYDGWTALCLAARLNRYKVVKALIDKGADVNYVHWDSSYSALSYCIVDGCSRNDKEQMKTIDLLLNAGATLDYYSYTDKPFNIFTLACRIDSVEIAKKLFHYNPNLKIDVPDYHDDLTPIEFALEHKNQELIDLINTITEKQKLENSLKNSNKNSTNHKL